jgi:peptidyl-prolyl cis-trans isomerase SurA
MQKMTPALRKYLAQLREEAYIDIKPGYVDSGASANETKPIFSAYTPPVPKKKKKLERTRFGGRGRTRTHSTTQSAAAAPPAGVPSLADVPHGDASTTTAAATSKPVAKSVQTASAGTMKPGKKEKIRYGQAPRETLPAGSSETEDAGATAANGNGSATEQQLAAEQTPPNTGAPAGARYNNGDSVTDATGPAVEEKKTRFADRAKLPKVKKSKKKTDPFSPDQAAPEEIADKQTQAAPLGLNGDTSKKPAKAKPTGGKTRYSDETKDDQKAKSDAADAQQNPPAAPAAPVQPNPPAADSSATPAPAQTQPQ